MVQFSEELDSLSATTPGNYSITDLQIEDVELKNNNTQVILHTSEIAPQKSYTLAAFNIKDNSPEGNTKSYSVSSVINNQPVQFPLRINIGGESIYQQKYMADQLWSPEVEFGHMDGYDEEVNGQITGTEEDI